jgi:probable rRNA maturation factor
MPEAHSSVLFEDVPRSLSRRKVKVLAARIEAEVAEGRHFTCLVTSDAALERLNRQFLGRDYAADVLSFPSPSPDGFLGETAISAGRAAEQAARYGHSLEEEIGILLLHGVLHLIGMDHESDRGRMARAERRYRRLLGLPGGLIERVRT